MNKLTKIFIILCLFSVNSYADGTYESKEANSSYSDESSSIIKNSDGNRSLSSSLDKSQSKRFSLSEKELLKYQYCGRDSDCIAVINGCCQCIQGDPYVAINKDSLEAFQSKFNCEDVLCPKEELTYACEDGVVSCISQKCKYFPPK